MESQTTTDTFYNSLKERSKSADDYGELEGFCIYARYQTDALAHIDRANEFMLDGVLLVVLSRGAVAMIRNNREYRVEGPDIMFFTPGTGLRLGSIELEEVEMHLLYFTRAFVEDLNLRMNAFSSENFVSDPRPDLPLTDRELSQELRYIKIIRNVMDDNFNATLNRHIVSSLVSSLVYQNMLYAFKRMGVASDDRQSGRRNNYVREFIRLVHLYYTKERSVLFYAGKLCVSAKYLSILVKEATGRSAAAWIDQFVLMEAKNLLRFSGKNVQQVAYALNFVNQSAFGKYFKHLTGMSPSEYQRQR